MTRQVRDLVLRLSPGISWAVALSVLSVILLVLLGNQILGVSRVFVVSGHTTGASIAFSGDGDAWSFEKATVCTPRSRPARASGDTSAGEGACDDRKYAESTVAQLALRFDKGARADLRRPVGGPLEIRLVNAVGAFPAGTLVIVPVTAWQSAGALAFKGAAQLGQAMGSGNRAIALSGKYEIREAEILTRITSALTAWWSRAAALPRSVVVDEGEIFRGEVIRVVDNRPPHAPVSGFGHITAGQDGRGFNMVYISPSGDHFLEVAAIGADTPTRIRPTWLDTASTSPTLIVLVIVLSILANAAQAVETLRKSKND
jgi:hypothetical protein